MGIAIVPPGCSLSKEAYVPRFGLLRLAVPPVFFTLLNRKGNLSVLKSQPLHKQKVETRRTVLSADKTIKLTLTSDQQLMIRSQALETPLFLDSVGVLSLANVLHIAYDE